MLRCAVVGLVHRCCVVFCCDVPRSAWYAGAVRWLAWYAAAVSWWCCVTLRPAWYAGVVFSSLVVGLVRRCCVVLCRVALFALYRCPLLVGLWPVVSCDPAFSVPLLASAPLLARPLGWGVCCASLGPPLLAGSRGPWGVCSFAQSPLSAPSARDVCVFSSRVRCAFVVALVVLWRCCVMPVLCVACRLGAPVLWLWCCCVVVVGVWCVGMSAWYASDVAMVLWCSGCGCVVCDVSCWYAGAMVVFCGGCGPVVWSVPAWRVGVVLCLNKPLDLVRYNYARACKMHTYLGGNCHTHIYHRDSGHTIGNKHHHPFPPPQWLPPPVPTQTQTHEAKVHRVDT